MHVILFLFTWILFGHSLIRLPRVNQASIWYSSFPIVQPPNVLSLPHFGSNLRAALQSNLRALTCVQHSKQRVQRARSASASLYQHLSHTQFRTVSLTCNKEASGWLNVLPLEDERFSLNKEEFRDALALRYDKFVKPPQFGSQTRYKRAQAKTLRWLAFSFHKGLRIPAFKNNYKS